MKFTVHFFLFFFLSSSLFSQTDRCKELAGWYISYGGKTEWEKISQSKISSNYLRFGDFDGDGKTDVFTSENGRWKFSSGGKGIWQNLGSSQVNIRDLRFGDFDGDGKTDGFVSSNSRWKFSSGGNKSWQNLSSSGVNINNLGFGDFDGDGKTDVFASFDGRLRFSSGGNKSWQDLGFTQVNIRDLRFGDFDGDGKTDVLASFDGRLKFSSGGNKSWQDLAFIGTDINNLRFGDFDGDGKTDVLYLYPYTKPREYRSHVYSENGGCGKSNQDFYIRHTDNIDRYKVKVRIHTRKGSQEEEIEKSYTVHPKKKKKIDCIGSMIGADDICIEVIGEEELPYQGSSSSPNPPRNNTPNFKNVLVSNGGKCGGGRSGGAIYDEKVIINNDKYNSYKVTLELSAGFGTGGGNRQKINRVYTLNAGGTKDLVCDSWLHNAWIGTVSMRIVGEEKL